jgi:cation diffusion facilitator family transporter
MQATSESSSDADGGLRLRAVRRAVLLTLALNLAVAIAKIAYGSMANALAIRADGFHSLTDSSNNLVGLIAIWIASRPPDRGHPYGHSKFEILAAGVVGLSLLAMAYDVARSAFHRMFSADASLPMIDAGAFVVLGVTLAVNIGVARWERVQGERHGSAFLVSDAAHTRSDVLVTLGVILASVLVRAGYPEVDLFAALAVSTFIAAAGVRVLWRNLGYLTDAALLDPHRIERLVVEVPGVASAHKIRTRGTPMRVYVDLHIQIAPELTVVDAHRVTHWVIDAIKQGLPDVVDVMVHTEPAPPGAAYRPLPPADEPRSA